ncbi:MAG: RIP metalloprotease [Myxococcales bacterium]|nr:RIP metalloprotease [Myxococcales bacterium]
MFSILLGILGLSVMIIIHEFGHFVCARATGMRVDRFSVFGIGPVALRLGRWKDTEFVISWIPFGAYVHIIGMEAGEEPSQALPPADGSQPVTYDPNDPYLYRNRPVWARGLAILGGPLANYVAAMLMFFGLSAVYGLGTVVSVRTTDRLGDSAVAAGMQPGDEFLKIGGVDVTGRDPDLKVMQEAGAHKGEVVPVQVRRGEQELTLQVPVDEAGKFGVGLTEGRKAKTEVSLGEAAAYGVQKPWIESKKALASLGKLFTGEAKMDQMSGPIGIVKAITVAAERGVEQYLVMVAVIGTLLGMFNLLPLPALDGGRMVFMLIEAVARRPFNKQIEEQIHGYGMLALLALILWITVRNDLLGNILK